MFLIVFTIVKGGTTPGGVYIFTIIFVFNARFYDENGM